MSYLTPEPLRGGPVTPRFTASFLDRTPTPSVRIMNILDPSYMSSYSFSRVSVYFTALRASLSKLSGRSCATPPILG